MNGVIEWIHAEKSASLVGNVSSVEPKPNPPRRAEATIVPWKNLPRHNFPARTVSSADAATRARHAESDESDLWLYRDKTVAMLRRYMRWSLEAGRVPSLLGRELFRSRASSYSATTFESRVIFIHDVERCLDRLNEFERELIARAVLQGHSHHAAARFLHCTRRTVERRLPDVLDKLSADFLNSELLVRLPDASGGIQ